MIFLILFSVGIILRLISFFTRYHGPFPWNPNAMEDYRVYAANLIMHGSFSYHWPVPSTYRLPLYPVLLIPFMKHLDAFLLLQVVLSMTTVWMVWNFIRNGADSRVASLAILPLILDLPTIQNASATLGGETVFTFLIVWAFTSTVGLSAILFSLAALTRTHGIFIPLGFIQGPKWLLIALSLPLLWLVRNGLVAHQWRLSDSSDYYTLCLAEQVTHKTLLNYEQDAYEHMNPVKLAAARVAILTDSGELPVLIAANSFKFFFATNSEYILDWAGVPRPTSWNTQGTKISGQGTLFLLKKYEWLFFPTVYLTLMLCFYYLMFLGGLIQLAWDNRWRELWMLVWVSFCIWLPSVLVSGSPHYRTALLPFICIGASIFIEATSKGGCQ